MTRKQFDIVVAYSIPERGIGIHGKLPWNIPQDLERFKEITTQTEEDNKSNVLIMGRKTFESIGCVLPKRYSFVITRDKKRLEYQDPYRKLYYFPSLDKALECAEENENTIENIFVIGGSSIYKEAIHHPQCRAIYATEVYPSGMKRGFDAYFPEINNLFSPNRVGHQTKDTLDNIFAFVEYRKNSSHPEKAYHKLLEDLINHGDYRETRNGNTYSLFGAQLEFDVAQYGFPLLTTKRVFFRGIAEELIWFIRGRTNAKELAEKGVHIWDANGSKEFQRMRGLDTKLEEGDCGPIYGFQWRHFGAEYKGWNANYTGQGRDQLMDVINQLEYNPHSRRIIINGWNASQLDEMTLPPCHVQYQFYVRENYLDCHLYQRSADVFLGLPFNIASTALFTSLIANSLTQRELKVGRIIISLGDYHLYEEHIEQAKEQIKRSYPYPFPTLRIKEKKKIDEYVYDDIILEDYKYYPSIKAPMKA